jgi:phage gpG-like protein
MLGVTFRVRAEGAEKLMQGLVYRASDVKPVLRRWVGYMRKHARKRFDELSGPPLAPSTAEKYAGTRTSNVTAAGNVRASYARTLEAQLRKKRTGEMNLAELRRLARGGSSAFSLSEAQDKSIERLRKRLEQARKTGKRVGGNRRKIERHKLLGRLVGALQGSVTRATAILRNRVRWSAVHNEGGTAGRGASIPKRETLTILAEDVSVFAEIALSALLGERR